MGKTTGFLEYERKTYSNRPAEERVRDYKEIPVALPNETISVQAARCMDCGIPFCHSMGCPVYNLIPEWNDLVYKGNWLEAYERLEMTNTLPEITGRICPAPCEASCTLSINSSPVTIKQIELAIIENAFARGWVTARPPFVETGKKVAIIGSGPAGISAAQQLRRLGHTVTVFEKQDKIGGILRYGIPDFKLEKWVIDRRLAQLVEEGVNFETSVHIGDDLSARYLLRAYQAVLVTMGAGEPRDLKVPGRDLGGIRFAMEYLTESNRRVAGLPLDGTPVSGEGKNVLVIGGGDTGSDCVGTARRQGAKNVYQFEILEKPREWKDGSNPQWPWWPQILRTSSSHEEGCERRWGILTKQFSGDATGVKKIHCVKVEWTSPGPGKSPAMREMPGSEFSLDVDLVLLAMGFLHVTHNRLLDDFKVAYDPRGNIETKNYATSVPGVFAAGDAGIGASLVVRAIFHGREAAKAIDGYLREEKQ
jgi:glutamate synthase (NADPH) small chain